MLNAHASANIQNDVGGTALMYAAYYGYLGVVNELLKDNSISVDKANSAGGTALMLASIRGHHDVVKALLEAGADRTLQDNTGRTARMMASHRKHQEVLNLFKSTSYYWTSRERFYADNKIVVSKNLKPIRPQ